MPAACSAFAISTWALRDPTASARVAPASVARIIDKGDLVSVDLPLVATYRADGWTALGDPTRRAIFERLADRPRAVGELASELPVSRPAVSQHLKVLKQARLVVDRRAGNRRIYQLDPNGVGTLRADLDQFWSKALAAYKTAIEKPTEEV
jgi:DNA-binding transcriptional ArsR family regulator